MRIVTVEEFWKVVDELRRRKGLNWHELTSGNTKVAVKRNENISLETILNIQKKLDVTLIKATESEEFRLNELIYKDPTTPEKMNQIYQWICSENWMSNEEVVNNVQKLAKTII